MSDLHEADILEWSERQSALLRQIAAGTPPNEPPDWHNIIEELAEAGLNRLRACRSLLVQAIAHEMKAAAWPTSEYVARWRHDAANFRVDAREVFTPFMRRRLDLEAIYRRALRELPPEIDGKPPLPLPPTCPMTLEELLAQD
jgi:hypothetical protein